VGSEKVSDVRGMDKEKERKKTGRMLAVSREARTSCYDGGCFRDLAYSSSWLRKPRFG